MSRENLLKAVQLADGQAKLAAEVRKFMPQDCKITQAYISQWLNPNKVKCEVPPPEYVIAISQAVDWQITPHELRHDIYPNPSDGMPRSLCACSEFKEAA